MDQNEKSVNTKKGFVYILEVKDIVLPVSKIGMTTRDPYSRCAEINNGSTGDFLWEVAYYVHVDDCADLESLVHRKLAPLRMKRREFFNLSGLDAYKALQSILEAQDQIHLIDEDIPTFSQARIGPKKVRKYPAFRQQDGTYAEYLQAFTEVFQVKGRPFGQLNKDHFGISDGYEGVQWNMVVYPKTDTITLGINLEGMKYQDWPISRYILSELEQSELFPLIAKIPIGEEILLNFTRDAWQVTSRPLIKEQYLGGRQYSMKELTPELWESILQEALQCLDETREYQGRAKQKVTLAVEPKNGKSIREMEVSPHLGIVMVIPREGDIEEGIKDKMRILQPFYDWVRGIVG